MTLIGALLAAGESKRRPADTSKTTTVSKSSNRHDTCIHVLRRPTSSLIRGVSRNLSRWVLTQGVEKKRA